MFFKDFLFCKVLWNGALFLFLLGTSTSTNKSTFPMAANLVFFLRKGLRFVATKACGFWRSQIQCTAADALWLQYGTKHTGQTWTNCTAVVYCCFDELLGTVFLLLPGSCDEVFFSATIDCYCSLGRGFCDVCHRAAVREQSFFRGVQLKLDPLLVELLEQTWIKWAWLNFAEYRSMKHILLDVHGVWHVFFFIHQSGGDSCWWSASSNRSSVLTLRNQSPKSPNRTQPEGQFFSFAKKRLNPNKNLKVKKRILEELEVPREARKTPFFPVKFGRFLSTSWPFAAVEPGWNLYCCWKKRGSVPSLPWSLYGRDDDVSQAAMLMMAESWDFAGNLCDLNVFFWFRLAVVQPDDIDMDEDADENEARRVTCRLIMRMEYRMFDNRFPVLKVYKALKQLDIKRATGEPLPKIFHGSSMAHGCMFALRAVQTLVLRVSERRALICLRGVVQEFFRQIPFWMPNVSNSKEFTSVPYLWRTYKIPIRQPYKKMRPV